MFQTALGIARLRPLKPDATLEGLPGGIERLFVASLVNGTDITQALNAIGANDEVEYAEPVYVTGGGDVSIQVVRPAQESSVSLGFPNDWFFSSQWDLHNTGQSDGTKYGIVGADINVMPAWQITTGSGDVLVAFLSTGLFGRSTEMTNVSYHGYRVQGGYNFVDDTNDFTDDNGIGSVMTGIADATGNNSYGIAGVDWKCQILPVKVVDSSYKSSAEWFASGLIYAADQSANVIVIGWGGPLNGCAYDDAITYAASKGAVIVAGVASGYSYFNTYPASYNKVILVGSTDNQDKRMLSTYGRVDFMAPGDKNLGIWKTEPAFGAISGPLGAAPLVAGVISLMLNLNKSLTFEEVYDILKESAADQVGWAYEDTPGWDPYYGWGRVDAYRALRVVKEHSKEIPAWFGTTQNYPNPFNPETTIEYDLPKTNGSRLWQVSLKIYNLLGQPVATIVDELQAAGYHHAQWNANAPSGVYFYRLQVDDRVVVKKMILALKGRVTYRVETDSACLVSRDLIHVYSAQWQEAGHNMKSYGQTGTCEISEEIEGFFPIVDQPLRPIRLDFWCRVGKRDTTISIFVGVTGTCAWIENPEPGLEELPGQYDLGITTPVFWSRDGKGIYFHSRKWSQQLVCYYSLADGLIQTMTPLDASVRAFEESHNGKYLVYADVRVEATNLYLLDLNSRESTILVPAHDSLQISNAAFSPDDRRIAFGAINAMASPYNRSVWLFDRSDSTLTPVAAPGVDSPGLLGWSQTVKDEVALSFPSSMRYYSLSTHATRSVPYRYSFSLLRLLSDGKSLLVSLPCQISNDRSDREPCCDFRCHRKSTKTVDIPSRDDIWWRCLSGWEQARVCRIQAKPTRSATVHATTEYSNLYIASSTLASLYLDVSIR